MAKEEPKIRIAAQYKKELDLRRLAGVLIGLAIAQQADAADGSSSPSGEEAP